MNGGNNGADQFAGDRQEGTVDRRDFLRQVGLASGALLLGSGITAPSVAQAARAPTLQSAVAHEVRRLREAGAIRADEDTSWSVYDFAGRRKLVSINEEEPRQAASMFKPFVALAYFYTVQRRGSGAGYSPELRAVMERMIRFSGNDETNYVMQLVSKYNGGLGPQATEVVLKRNAPDIFRQVRIVEYIPEGGRTYRNQASARDYSRFLLALWEGRLPYAAELKTLMGLPNRNRITTNVASIPAGVRVYHKTGSTARLCGDMGIVESVDSRGRPRPYTFVGIIEKPAGTSDYGAWIKTRGNAIRSVSGVVYAHMREQHGLA